MFYFKFKIPTNKDGTVATYSPGWCGTRDKCAKNEKGLLYNDKELWGIGQADGDYIPDDVEVVTKESVINLIRNNVVLVKDGTNEVVDVNSYDITISSDGMVNFTSKIAVIEHGLDGSTKEFDWNGKLISKEEQVYFGEKLANRYLPETIKEEIEDTPESLKEESKVANKIVADTFAQSCPICHKMVAYVVKYEDGSCKIVQNGRTLIDGIKAKEINLMCPDNHKVKVVIDNG